MKFIFAGLLKLGGVLLWEFHLEAILRPKFEAKVSMQGLKLKCTCSHGRRENGTLLGQLFTLIQNLASDFTPDLNSAASGLKAIFTSVKLKFDTTFFTCIAQSNLSLWPK